MCCSSAQQACGAVGARTEPDGWCSCRPGWRRPTRAGSGTGRPPSSPRAAGRTGRRRCRRRCRAPAGRGARPACRRGMTPVSSSITWPSRRWSGAMNSSRREKTSRTGRPAARARAATCASKWNSHLPPKPPPRCGTITRTWPRASAACGHAAAGDERHLGRRPDRDAGRPATRRRSRAARSARRGTCRRRSAPSTTTSASAMRGVDVALDDRRAGAVVAAADEVVVGRRSPPSPRAPAARRRPSAASMSTTAGSGS